MNLKQIALDLLKKYKEAERALIWEYSGNISKAETELEKECEHYKALIELAAEPEEKTCTKN